MADDKAADDKAAIRREFAEYIVAKMQSRENLAAISNGLGDLLVPRKYEYDLRFKLTKLQAMGELEDALKPIVDATDPPKRFAPEFDKELVEVMNAFLIRHPQVMGPQGPRPELN